MDIDCHEQDVPYELYARELVARSRRDLFDCGAVPEPNSIVYTGRGVQFWWALESTSKALLHVYQRAQSWMLHQFDQLIEEYPSMLSDLKVDAAASRNVVGYFRLPMTYNTAIHKKSSFALLHTKRYKLTDLVEQFVPKDFSEKAYTRKRLQSQASSVSAKNASIEISANDVAVFEGGTNAMARRVLKMVELRALRNAPKGKETRDLLCFVVYCALLSIHEQDEAWKRLLAFNKGFKQPMMTEELEEVMAAAQRNRYHLTNEWIIEKLEITTQEQLAIDLYVCETGEKRGSNYSRDLLRRKKKEVRNTEILSLFSKGKNQSEIAEEMHLSRNTVAKVLKAANVLSPKKQEPAGAQLMRKNDVEEDIVENVTPETGAQKRIIFKKEQKWACSNSVHKLRIVSYRGTHNGKTTESPTVKIHPHSRGRPPT